MYQAFFQLNTLPFSLTPNPNFYCQLKEYQKILLSLLTDIQNGEEYIKIIGESGAGKTMLCKKLLENLHGNYIPVYLFKPHLNAFDLCKMCAYALGLNPSQWHSQGNHIAVIHRQLSSLHANGKQIILLIDEAQTLMDESFDVIHSFTHSKNTTKKGLQIILFGQPELDQRLHNTSLHQLKVPSYILPFMTRKELDIYLQHRLKVAGYHNNKPLFTRAATNLLFKASGGIPQIVNVISHKALLVAYGGAKQQVDRKIMRLAIDDTETAKKFKRFILLKIILVILTFLLFMMLFVFWIGNMPL